MSAPSFPQEKTPGGPGWIRPAMVIAHRGASGYLPEHTREGYSFAYALGVDMLEPDLTLTKDDVLICLHDTHLDRVTDVAQRFPGRAREDGRFYAIDFTLDEVRTLSATGGERHRFRGCAIPTFQEFIDLVSHLNDRTSGDVGIMPELKSPAFHRAEGHPMEELYVQALRAFGYHKLGSRCVTQSFEPDTLLRLAKLGVETPLLELLEGDAPSAAQLEQIRGRAQAIGVSKAMVTDTGGQLVRDAHRLDLAVTVYTFQEDEEEARRFFTEFKVDGLFSDFPDVALRARP